MEALFIVAFVVVSLSVGLSWPVAHWWRRRRMRRLLPVLAARLGLRHVESRVIDSMGEYVGLLQGYRVRIEPEDGLLQICCKASHDVDLAGPAGIWKPEPGWVQVRAVDPLFNRLLGQRHVSAGLAYHFETRTDLLEVVVRFLRRYKTGFAHRFRYNHVRIKGGLVEDRPHASRHPDHIPMNGLHERLVAMVDIARALDEVSCLPKLGAAAGAARACGTEPENATSGRVPAVREPPGPDLAETGREAIYVDDRIVEYAGTFVSALHAAADAASSRLPARMECLAVNERPEDTAAVVAAARKHAAVQGRAYVVPGDVARVIGPVLASRVILTEEAVADGLTVEHLVSDLIARLDPP
jgi:hypothetical protein